MKPRKWVKKDLVKAAKSSRSIRQVIEKIGLVPAGGNYEQIKRYLKEFDIDTSHFRGQGWLKGLKVSTKPAIHLSKILTKNSSYQAYKLKLRLFKEGMKKPQCEFCGWNKKAKDGRIPVELDHINGDRHDHRLENLRILCPNCHSLQPTHRGKNIKRKP
ncbi:MAG: HNH endonuclease [Parcubacteria group bacterium]|nr:HNH endonuclease [Parcubacteria group bacterium]